MTNATTDQLNAAAVRRSRSHVRGYDYRTHKPVAMTPAEWRKAFPPEQFVRATTGAKGETWYRGRQANGHAGELVAEAYAIIPEAK